MIANSMYKAVAGWFAQRAARALRPTYLPATLAPDGAQVAADLELAYQRAVVEGYQAMRGLMGKQEARKAPHTLRAKDITGNVLAVGEQFAKAAAKLDPDGLASEIIRLFCVGVPHMDKLDNQRRIATVWSALLAPAVVMREKRDHAIVLDDLVTTAVKWIQTGTTDLAAEAYESPDTRFISAHPARVYDLLTDMAKQHGLDHMKLMRSMIEPVLLPLGQYVGSRQAAGGVKVEFAERQVDREVSK
jgi:predicted alpha/beta-hydrolase family hydrolase